MSVLLKYSLDISLSSSLSLFLLMYTYLALPLIPPISKCPAPCLTWWVALDRLVVHLEGGVATTACEAHNMVLAIANYDSRLVNGDVICPHVEDHIDLSLFLGMEETEGVSEGKQQVRYSQI